MNTVSVRYPDDTFEGADASAQEALALAGEPLEAFPASRLDRGMALADLAHSIVAAWPLITTEDRATLAAALYPEGVTA